MRPRTAGRCRACTCGGAAQARITDKSEWLCRRQEIIKQQYAFIWGEKPVPPEGATTGTVSTSTITVSVATDEGSTQFTLSVNMNGATAPAPAIISYGAGAPAPNGVARITFTAVEQSGGSGAKTGPFYDVYGANHPAGYLTAQAWQISRVLDVLEQDPSVIDPQRVGLTGCSRNGKGAFVGGALDNRVALTIPVESGLGGAVGLLKCLSATLRRLLQSAKPNKGCNKKLLTWPQRCRKFKARGTAFLAVPFAGPQM